MSSEWHSTERSYFGERRRVSELCTKLFGYENSRLHKGKWQFDTNDGKLDFRNEEDRLWFLIQYTPNSQD